MLKLVVIKLFRPPYDKDINLILISYQSPTQYVCMCRGAGDARVQNVTYQLFLSITCFVIRNPSVWCATRLYFACLNISICRMLGVNWNSFSYFWKKDYKSNLRSATHHSIFSSPQGSFKWNLGRIANHTCFSCPMTTLQPYLDI